MAAFTGECEARPAVLARIVTGTWVMRHPARAAITRDSTVSPRYSAG